MDNLQNKFIKEFLNKKNILRHAIYTSSDCAVFSINGVVIRLKDVTEVGTGYCLLYMLVYAYTDGRQTEQIKVYHDHEFYAKLKRLYENYLFEFRDQREIKYMDLINKIRKD